MWFIPGGRFTAVVCLCNHLSLTACYYRYLAVLPVCSTTIHVPCKSAIPFSLLTTIMCKMTWFITVVTNLPWRSCHIYFVRFASKETLRYIMTYAFSIVATHWFIAVIWMKVIKQIFLRRYQCRFFLTTYFSGVCNVWRIPSTNYGLNSFIV
jgi:hypothetical protein